MQGDTRCKSVANGTESMKYDECIEQVRRRAPSEREFEDIRAELSNEFCAGK